MAQFTAVRNSVRRLDGERKVTGIARYTADLQLPGLLHARLVTAAHPHARITGIDRRAALEVPGVLGVYTAADLPAGGKERGGRNLRPLAEEYVRFEGQPVAVVVAESLAAAQDAADLVEVGYDELEVVADPEAALAPDSPLVLVGEARQQSAQQAHTSVGAAEATEEAPPNAAGVARFRRGNVDAGLAEADVVIERTYRVSWIHQLHLEPQSSTVAPDGQGGVTVWTSTQAAFDVRSDVAITLGLPRHRVNVIAMEVGGGFGAKYGLLDALTAAVAWKLQRPVSLVYTRAEELRAGNPAPGGVLHVTAGARRDGSLTALRARVVLESGAFAGQNAGTCAMLLGGQYRWPNVDITGYEVLTHKTGAGAYRAPGAPQACFAIEGHMEEMARALDLDPLEFRLRNAVVEGDPMPSGRAFPRIGGVEVLEALAEHPAWTNRQRRPGEGVGIAFGWWGGGAQPASATCRLNEDGSLSATVGSTDISGSNTSMALIAAEAFGIPVEQVDVRSADTNTAPFGGPSGGSKTLVSGGAAVRAAATDARRQALAIAAQELEAAPEDLELISGAISVRGVPGRSITLADVAEKSISWGGSYEPVLGRGGSAISSASPQFTAHLARVAVDEETGEVRVLEYVAVQDVGCAINPAEVEGQIHGGVVQGLGFALSEAIPYGEDGRLLGASLMDYALPTAERIPPIDAVLVEVPSPDGPYGAKGVGEPPIVPPPAAIANAIYDATGVRPTALPITPPRLLEALQRR